MSRKRKENPKKKINPVYFVFCEGESEEAYSTFLRQKYRVPIQIKTKVTGQKISDTFIKNHVNEIRRGASSPLDKTYLMYDLDSEEFKNRLLSITSGIILASNPNIELWFLLHYRQQKAHIDSSNCIRILKGLNKSYEKGELNSELEEKLTSQVSTAVKRAKELTEFDNPSSTIYKFLEELISIKNKK